MKSLSLLIFLFLLICFVISLFFGRFRIESYPRYTTVRRHARKGTRNGVSEHQRSISDGYRWIWVPHYTPKEKNTDQHYRMARRSNRDVSFNTLAMPERPQLPTQREIIKTANVSSALGFDLSNKTQTPAADLIKSVDSNSEFKTKVQVTPVECELTPLKLYNSNSINKPEKPTKRDEESIDDYQQRVLEWDDLYNASLDEVMNIRNYEQRLKRRIFGK